MMGMITSIRAPLPAVEAQSPTTLAPLPQGGFGAAAPVVAPSLAQAVQQASPGSAANDPELMAARMTVETCAAAAAEAARDAYIKASIAAGISPLPLP